MADPPEFLERARLLERINVLLEELEYSEISMRDFIHEDNSYNLACLIKAHRRAEELISAIAKAKA